METKKQLLSQIQFLERESKIHIWREWISREQQQAAEDHAMVDRRSRGRPKTQLRVQAIALKEGKATVVATRRERRTRWLENLQARGSRNAPEAVLAIVAARGRRLSLSCPLSRPPAFPDLNPSPNFIHVFRYQHII
jgi:hypothetical protein